MSSARRASNGFSNRQIVRRITWLTTSSGLIPTVLLCLLAYLYWRSWYSQPNKAFLQLIAELGVFSFVVIGLTNWLAARRLSFSMQKLAEAMGKFASGQWDERAAVRQSDPLANLALLFNQIADDYRAAYQSLTVHQPEAPAASNLLIQRVSSLLVSAQSQDELLSGALDAISRSLSSMYAAVYLLEEDTSRQRSFLNLIHDQKAAGFDPGSLKPVDGNQQPFLPGAQGVRIALDKTGQLDWPLKRAINTGKSIIQEAAPEKEIMEAAVPLVRNGRVVGVLDLYVPASSPDPQVGMFSYRSLWEVEQASGLLALAVEGFQNEQKARHISAGHTGSQDGKCMPLYQASSLVAQAASEEDALQAAWQALESSPNPCAVWLTPSGSPDQLQVVYESGRAPSGSTVGGPGLAAASLAACFNAYTPLVVTTIQTAGKQTSASPDSDSQNQPDEGFPQPLLDMAEALGCQTAAFLPVQRGSQVFALMLVGSPTLDVQQFSVAALEPYRNLIEVLVNNLENIRSAAQTKRQLAELHTFWNVSQVISIETDLDQLFVTIHRQLETVLGDLRSFAIALYEATDGTIRIPYMTEEGSRLEVPPFPLGEGLTSILVRTGKPLLLCEDVEAQSKALGAKVLGEPAKSWLGAPMLYGGEVIGAIIVQDILHTGRFNMDDQRLLSALANEVAVVVHNARLLEATRQQARQERLINEISAKIRRSSDIQTILKTTVVELGTALGVQKAHIQLGLDQEPVSMQAGGGQ
jgi:GAF domain-containing protein